MKRLVIHIGTAKTGTSAIQKFMHDNRQLLEERKILYPLSGQFGDRSHHELAFSFAPDGFRDDSNRSSKNILDGICKEISAGEFETVVLSSECFPCLLNFEDFKKCFNDYEIRVVCFIRDPVSYIESWYRQWVKDTEIRYSAGFDTFFDEYSKQISVKNKLNLWLNHLDESHILVKDFDEIKKSSDITLEFLKILEVNDSHLFKKVDEINQSLGYVGTKIMEVSNSLGDNPARNKLLGVVMGMRDYGKYIDKKLISKQQAEVINSLYLEENNKLIDRYKGWL